VLMLWSSYYRDVMLTAAQASSPLANIDHADEIAALAKSLSLPQARKSVGSLERAVELLDKNINARLLAEVTLLDLPKGQ
jgi:hypothetical protein